MKKKRMKAVKPDEVFEQGPFRFARFGDTTFFESNVPEDIHAELVKKSAERYPLLIQEVDDVVESIAALVSSIRPESLLYRAWWEFSASAFKTDSETGGGFEDSISLRMIDYIQSIIASVTPDATQTNDVTDEEWYDLRGMVERLFHLLGIEYHICRTAKSKLEDQDYDPNFDEFYVKAQMYWCNVRGRRHQAHMLPYFRDMFLPHSAVIEELSSITAEELVQGLEKLWHSLTFGIGEIYDELESFHKDSIEAMEKMIEDGRFSEETNPAEVFVAAVTENDWHERQKEVVDRFFSIGLFDVAKVSGLPDRLIAELTWEPGGDKDFFSDGDFRGWPLRIWPVFKRPFIQLDGRNCCFDLHSISDNIYRAIQKTCSRLNPECREQWNQVQQEQSEELPLHYFEKILPGATVYRSVYYRWYPNPSCKKKDWCEADGLLIYDDQLFVIEVKAGAFTYTSPTDDFPAFVKSLKTLVMKPAAQGKRFLEYLEDADQVSIFDKEHDEIGQISNKDFRKKHICPITLDPFTELAAQVQHLRKIGVDVGSHPVWAVSLDDLRVYADIFQNPLLFIHYVEQRMRSFLSDTVQVDDELDHLGLYLKHNNYSLHAEEMRASTGARIQFNGYRSGIDEFFSKRLIDPTTPCPLVQAMPDKIFEIVSFLSNSTKAHKSELSSYILDLDSETREQFAQIIEQEINNQPRTLRPKPFSSHGGIDFTLYCYRQGCSTRYPDDSLDHARTVMLVRKDERRLLIELSYSQAGVLDDVHWRWILIDEIPDNERDRLQTAADSLAKNRVQNALALRRKIGRNEQCPCGSGKKYKKCCLK